MITALSVWWAWITFGLGLLMMEALVPAYIFLGFAIGAIVTGLIIVLNLPGTGWIINSIPVTLVFFSLVSGASWIALRLSFGPRRGRVKSFDRDINDDP